MSVLIPIAHGSESLETIALVNVLRRADLSVCLASIEPTLELEGTRGIRLLADQRLDEVIGTDHEAIILPGGEPGSRALAASNPLIERLLAQRLAHHWYGAICAAPALVLSANGLLDGKQATCHPHFREHLLHFVDRPVVVDGHCITSQGAGTAVAFALEWVERLCGASRRSEVASQLCVPETAA